MNKKKIISISIVAIVIIALASLSVNFSLENNRNLEELHKSHVQEAQLAASDIWQKLSWFVGLYYNEIHDLTAMLRPENSYYNETKLRVIYGKCELLRYVAERFWIDVEEDLGLLRGQAYYDKYISFFNGTAFNTVYGAVRESLGQVDWAGRGKTSEEALNETQTFLWELYYVLGIDQIEQESKMSGLEGLARCFYELENYWYAEIYYGGGNIPKYLTPLETALEWAVRNATDLHQDLIQWDQYHEPSL